MVEVPNPGQGNALPYRQIGVEIFIPVHNDEVALPYGIEILCSYLLTYFPYRWSVVITDNASTDAPLATAEISAY